MMNEINVSLLFLLPFRNNELFIKAEPNEWAEKDAIDYASETILPEAIANFNSLHKGLSPSLYFFILTRGRVLLPFGCYHDFNHLS